MTDSAEKLLPEGAFPTMVTPFTEDGQVDFPALKALTNWYIASGCTGLFAVCLSSEMYNLTAEERIDVARAVHTTAAGRVPVIASGTFGGSIEEQAKFVLAMNEVVDAVVVLANQLAEEVEDDGVWKSNVQKLLDLTGDVSLGLYECPKPYHRLLSPEILGWCAGTGRFKFHKDTCCRTEPIKQKLKVVAGTSFGFYNANVATLRMSILAGGRGFSGICANMYPQVVSWLCANAEDPKAEHLQHLMSVWENVVCDQYPRSAKYYLSLFKGFPMTTKCRINDNELNEEAMLKLQSLKVLVDDYCQANGITVESPATFMA